MKIIYTLKDIERLILVEVFEDHCKLLDNIQKNEDVKIEWLFDDSGIRTIAEAIVSRKDEQFAIDNSAKRKS